jgi:hypothetical protein
MDGEQDPTQQEEMDEGQDEGQDENWGAEDEQQDMQNVVGGGNPIEYAELVKTEVLALYRDMCDESGQEANEAFCVYLEETFDENDALDIVI